MQEQVNTNYWISKEDTKHILKYEFLKKQEYKTPHKKTLKL